MCLYIYITYISLFSSGRQCREPRRRQAASGEDVTSAGTAGTELAGPALLASPGVCSAPPLPPSPPQIGSRFGFPCKDNTE